ncbi:MAG: HD domain-containing protein [Candidatus Paceibacterota bacterium]
MFKLNNKNEFKIPIEIAKISKTLEKSGFDSYLIGGCVRDLLIGKKPKDWDLTTNATPEQIISLFEETFYENDYGTVGVINKDVSDETLKVVEITPYRLESEYSDKRRPDSVIFSNKLEDDLKRRDFTINAIAVRIEQPENGDDLYKGQIIDPYKGQDDLKNTLIKAVGDPNERFKEDALRMIRATRLATELSFDIEKETKEAIKKDVDLLQHISKERIRDEFTKTLMSDHPKDGLILNHDLGILKFMVEELEKGINIKQNQAHSFDVWEHTLKTLQHSADKKLSLEVRLAALFHDIAKPQTRRWSEEKNDWTFYGHDVVSARVATKSLSELKFPKKIIEKVIKLVRWHMFFSDTEQITLSAVRRIVRNVGPDNIWDLMNLRMCDRIGTGRPKESPYRLRKYQSMIEEALREPISVGMLKINGSKLMEITKLNPSPKIGYILHALFEEVIENPKLNTEEYLSEKAIEMSKMSDNELKELGEKGKEKKEEEEEKVIEEIRKKYWVK